MIIDVNRFRFNYPRQLVRSLISICLFSIVCSTTVSAQEGSGNPNQAEPEIEQMKRFQYEERRSFTMDIPARWEEELATDDEFMHYRSFEDGETSVKVFRNNLTIEGQLADMAEHLKQAWFNVDFNNLDVVETNVEAMRVIVITATWNQPKDEGSAIVHFRAYFYEADAHIYTAVFRTANEDELQLIDQIANSVEVRRS